MLVSSLSWEAARDGSSLFASALVCARRDAASCRCPADMLLLNSRWLAAALARPSVDAYEVRFLQANVVALGEVLS